MLKNTEEFYGVITKFFHWLMAFLIICMLFLGYLMSEGMLTNIHKITGLTILTLVACRLVWTLANPHPTLPQTLSHIERIAARTAQVLLYVCMFVMPLSGWIMSTAHGKPPHINSFQFPMPGIPHNEAIVGFFKTIHNTTAIVFITLISLHVLGALKHHFIDRNKVLKNMLF